MQWTGGSAKRRLSHMETAAKRQASRKLRLVTQISQEYHLPKHYMKQLKEKTNLPGQAYLGEIILKLQIFLYVELFNIFHGLMCFLLTLDHL